MAIVRSLTVFLETAGDLSDKRHEKDPTAGYLILLTITKIGEERKDRGVAARQSAPLALVHCTPGFGRVVVLLDRGIFPELLGSGWPIKTRNFVLTDFAAAFIRALVVLKNSQSIVNIL